MINAGSLTVVGSGIKSISHLTVEAQVHIEKTKRLFFLVCADEIGEWIKRINPAAESLEPLYYKYRNRIDCYREITSFLVDEVKKPHHVTCVLYGHPTIFAMPALEAHKQLKKEGIPTWILPGISAEDCLIADLGIDPASHGCHSYEATDFLIRRRPIDPHTHLILWQVGVIGCLHHPRYGFDNSIGARLLQNTLLKYYPADHPVVLYEAATFPHATPRTASLPLSTLSTATITSISTLYVPPIGKAPCDREVMQELGLK